MLSKQIKLLIVDDEPALRESLSHLFIACGYGVCSAHDGFSALQAMKQELPDIVLSDLNMPGMSGFDFLPIVRRRFPAIHLIAMSAAFTGNGVPPGVVADAFYPKATGLSDLLRIMKSTADSRLDDSLLFASGAVTAPGDRTQGACLPNHSQGTQGRGPSVITGVVPLRKNRQL